MNFPFISIIMLVYNTDKYLQDSINSILAQSYSNFELIIANDGSTDNSKEIILSYRDNRIRYIENQSNQGIVKTRNECIKRAGGKYIAVLDSDDLSLKNRLELQVNFLEKHLEYGMCGTFYKVIDASGHIKHFVKLPESNFDIHTFLIFGNCICHSSVLMRTKLAKEFYYSSEIPLGEDFDLWYRISQIVKIANIPEFVTLYRVHGKNISIEKYHQMISYLCKLNACKLSDNNISLSNDELLIYTNLLYLNYSFFKTIQKIIELDKLLKKLTLEFKERKELNQDIIISILSKRWFLICIKTKNAHMLVNSSLWTIYKLKYLKAIKDIILQKIFKKQSIF